MKTSHPRCWAQLAGAVVALLAGCERAPSTTSGPLPQRGYLWQRHWSPAVPAALRAAQTHLQGIVLLGAEIEWVEKTPRVVRANVDWKAVKAAGLPCSIALRVAPISHPDAEALQSIASVAHSLDTEARAHQVELEEFQLDYDCAQKKLAQYRAWLPAVRAAVRPTRFVITALPSWLEEKEFAALIEEVDGYVLQVHSIPMADAGEARLCDIAAARRWVRQAAKLHRPFAVALPTYRCTAGYDEAGKLLGVAMDSVQPAWPPGTRRLELAAEADPIADLVQEWQRARPAELNELIWYRVPVASDTRNWRWPTLSAVMAGRKPARHFEVVAEGGNPLDLALRNSGESDDDRPGRVMANWSDGELIAADALAGWNVETQTQSAIFTVQGDRLRLPPGAVRNIGWLRYSGPVIPKFSVQYEKKLVR
ncbi:MAG: DUF3142 domain-containing protein [Chthoniobacterales bacterium]